MRFDACKGNNVFPNFFVFLLIVTTSCCNDNDTSSQVAPSKYSNSVESSPSVMNDIINEQKIMPLYQNLWVNIGSGSLPRA